MATITGRSAREAAAPPSPLPAGRIGPNAIIRLVEAVEAAHGAAAAASLLAQAKLDYTAGRLPEHMVDEAEVVALHRSLVDTHVDASALAADAGRRTAAYLLSHRIPRPAQRVLRLLPPSAASGLLLMAIARHAWTFTGSGRLVTGRGVPLLVDVIGGPLRTAGPAAGTISRYYAATFAHLYDVLVRRGTRVDDVLEAIDGVPACRLRLDWRRTARPMP